MRNVVIVLSLLFFIGCNNNIKNSPVLFSVTDDLNNKIDFNDYPRKIISLAPNITETIFLLGADSLLIGVTKYCDFPEQAKHKTIVGGILDPDYELISKLQPDLIFMTVEGNSKFNYESLKKYGFRIFMTNPRNIEGIIKMICDIGLMCNKKDTTAYIVKNFKLLTDTLINNVQNKSLVNGVILVSLVPLITVNKTTYINEVLKLSCINNIYQNEPIAYPQINSEDLILKNPEYIIYPCNKNESIKNIYEIIKEKLPSLDAVKKNNIIYVDEDLILRPGPRIFEAVHSIQFKLLKL
jgi:iron complex transport system substrate-binding protein